MSTPTKKTLEELEGDRWSEPDYPSHVVTTCHRLRKIPIQQLNIEDLRILLGQSIGVKYLVSLALDILSTNPLAEGDYYPGDLLCSVLRLAPQTWRQHSDWAKRLESIVGGIKDAPRSVEDECQKFLSRQA